MKINQSSNNINAQAISAGAFPNRIRRSEMAEKLGLNRNSFKLDDVQLTLSNQAQGLITIAERRFEPRPFVEIKHPEAEEGNRFDRNAFRERATKMGFQVDDHMIDFYDRIIRNQGASFGFRDDVRNMTALANSYAEIRQSLEAVFSGEELERRLSSLSEAFAYVSNRISVQSEWNATRRMNFETINMIKAMRRATGATGSMRIELPGGMTVSFFTAEAEASVDIPKALRDRLDKYMNTTEHIRSSIRETTQHFANLARQFALENGTVTTGGQMELLKSFLSAAERPEGSLTFDNLSTLNDIFSRNWRGEQDETMFGRLTQEFEFLNGRPIKEDIL